MLVPIFSMVNGFEKVRSKASYGGGQCAIYNGTLRNGKATALNFVEIKIVRIGVQTLHWRVFPLGYQLL